MSSPKIDNMTSTEMRKHLYRYNNMVRADNVVSGLRVMSKADHTERMKDVFRVQKDSDGHFNIPKSKKLLEAPNLSWFKDNRPKAYRKKTVVKKIPKRKKKQAEEPAPAPAPEPKQKAPKKKQRTAKQLANDKKLGEMAKKRAKAKKK